MSKLTMSELMAQLVKNPGPYHPELFTKKESSMNIRSILEYQKLREGAGKDDLTPIIESIIRPDDIQAEIDQMRKDKRKAAAKAAAESILAVEEVASNTLRELVGSLREARRTVRRQESHLNEYNRAKAFYEETGNILPLATACGQVHVINFPIEDRAFLTVPEDWTPAPK